MHGGGTQYTALCPAHDDEHASLSVSEGQDGRILLRCHAGCETAAILAALDLTLSDLFPDPPRERAQGDRRVVETYDYIDADGYLVAQKLRYEPKSFSWRRPDGCGGWVYNRKGVEIPLYRREGLKSTSVFLVEGEKDANTLTRLGLPAVCSPDGAGTGSKWRDTYTESLRGLHVAVIPDNDTVGADFARMVCGKLDGVAGSVRLLDLTALWPELPEHGDVSDLVQKFGETPETAQKLAELAKKTPLFEGAGNDRTEPAETRAHGLSVVSASDLQQKELGEVQFVVHSLLPQGLAILASPPKYGKSWFVLDLCLSVAFGEDFIGYPTTQNGCLYLALEDSERRLQARLRKLLRGRNAPGNFYFSTTAHDLSHGLLDELTAFLAQHPDTRLIVIDTLQKVRAPGGSSDVYGRDYRDVGALKAFADAHGVCVLLVHHLRKMQAIGDPFERISGTTGITGAADTTFVMARENRSDAETMFSVIGRDVEMLDLALTFDSASCVWRVAGTADEVVRQREKQAYETDPIVAVIRKLVVQGGGRWSGTAQDVLNAGVIYGCKRLAESPRALSNRLKVLKPQLLTYDGILYERVGNGTGGGRHSFVRADSVAFTELAEAGEPLPFTG